MMSMSLIAVLLFGCSSPEQTPTITLDVYPAKNESRAKVRHILLGYEGAWRSSSRRTKEDARLQIQGYRKQIVEGVAFGDLAQQFSEDTQKKEDGLVGVIGRGEMLEPFETAAFSLQINELSDVVETGFGFHLIQRLPLDERRVVHIEIDEETLVETIQSEINDGANPIELAKKYSIGPHGPRGGELGWFEKTDLDTPFVDSVFALNIGTCSTAIKRDNHWHFFCRQQ